MQKILILYTDRASMRAPVEGWGAEDGDLVSDAWYQNHKYENMNLLPVGLIRTPVKNIHTYPTVLHAIGDGWKLSGPPVKVNDNTSPNAHEWWLVKD